MFTGNTKLGRIQFAHELNETGIYWNSTTTKVKIFLMPQNAIKKVKQARMLPLLWLKESKNAK